MERRLALFIDFENIALGFQKGKDKQRFEIQMVLERLVEKGNVIVKKAYADWSRFNDYKKDLHEAAIELIEIPKRSMSGKNSADIRLCVDAIDLAYAKEHIDSFVVMSGDSDFSPLVSKLKENGKRVIGLGVKGSTSELLIGNCDEFIFYDDLTRPSGQPPAIPKSVPREKREAFQVLIASIVALIRENKEILYSSMVKDTMKRKRPSFNESYYGYRAFSELLEDAQKAGLISLRTDARSGTYVVAGFGNRGG
ncbi:MAG: NYN domain-containing protein [Planctomycetota bacterium]